MHPSNPNLTKALDDFKINFQAQNIYASNHALAESVRILERHPSQVRAWSDQLHSIIQTSNAHLLDISNDALYRELQSSEQKVTETFIESWHQALMIDRVKSFAEYLQTFTRDEYGNHTILSDDIIPLSLYERISCILAILHPDTAVNFTQSISASTQSNTPLDSQKLIRLSGIFSCVEDADRLFWHRVAHKMVPDHEWNTPETNECFSRLNRSAGLTSETLKVVRAILPSEQTFNVRAQYKVEPDEPEIDYSTPLDVEPISDIGLESNSVTSRLMKAFLAIAVVLIVKLILRYIIN